MSEKGSKGLREMTTGCALAGFLMPILVMIVLIVLGAEMTIASLAALFVMIGFCMFMGFKWERLDAAVWWLPGYPAARSQHCFIMA